MKRIVVFLNNAIFIPVLPCLVNIIIKFCFGSPWGWEYLDKGTLLFSISLYLITCFRGSSKITDKDLVSGLSAVYIILFVLSITLFALGLVSDTLFDKEIMSYIKCITSVIESPNNDKGSMRVFSSDFERSSARVGWLTIVFSALSVIGSEVLRYKYKIEGEIIS